MAKLEEQLACKDFELEQYERRLTFALEGYKFHITKTHNDSLSQHLLIGL